MERLTGRFVSEDFVDPKTGEILVSKNEYITENIADAIVCDGFSGNIVLKNGEVLGEHNA